MPEKNKAIIIRAALYYSAGIFLLGFLLGTLRTIVIVPRIGRLAGVLVEIPIMLAVSWFYCIRLTNRYSLFGDLRNSALFGVLSFLFLQCAEISFSFLIFREQWTDYIVNMGSLPGILGLSAQILFGFIPVLQELLRSSSGNSR